MTRNFIILFWILLFAIPGYAACTGSSPNLTAPTWDDVGISSGNCHSVASNGDTITVTAGSYTVTANTTISKYVKIIPGGSVTLTDNICAGFCGNENESLIDFLSSSAGPQQFGALGNGFHITQGTSIHSPPSAEIVMNGSNQPVLVLGNDYTTAQAGGVGGVMIQATASRGVISGNTLNTAPFGGNCNNTDFLVHISGTGSGWTEIAKFGNLDTDGTWKLYIENNVDNYGSEGVSNNDGSRAVIRFNTFRNGGIDHHGANTQAFGTRYTEVYKNNFVWDNRTWDTCTDSNRQNGSAGIGSGGGTSIFVANAMDTLDVIPSPGWGTKYSIALLEERPWRLSDGSGWKCWGTAMQPSLYAGFPIPYQNGWGYISGGTQAGNAPVYMDRQPWYFAGNTGSGITQVGSVVDPKIENYSSNECGSTQDVTDFLHADQEYYKQVPLGSFDGTTGASQGMRSERPSNCTTGVVFWSTDQGSWNNSGSGGQGVLDKCTSTNTWTDAWYVPFDYPHPLAITGPYISTLTPSSGNQGATSLSVAVVGSDTNFVNATTVCDFGSNITINSCTVSSATALTANITISSSAALGARSATFTTGGEVATKSNGFTVTSIGTISSLTPAAGLQGDTSLSIAVVGSNTNFVNGTTVCNFGSNITINSCTVASSTTLTANITIAGGATTGLRNATFTTGVEVATIVNGFTVSAVSTPTIFNPRMLRN